MPCSLENGPGALRLRGSRAQGPQPRFIRRPFEHDVQPVLKQSEDAEQEDRRGGVLIGDVKLSGLSVVGV